MTRNAWIAIGVLSATNLAWIVGWLAADEPAAAPDTFELEATITDLQAEIASLRRTEPVLLGVSEGAARDASGGGVDGQDVADDAADDRARAALEAQAMARAAEKTARKERRAAALAKAKEMLRKVLQAEEPALRRQGITEIQDALEGDDEELIEYVLSVIYSMRNASVDRSVFASQVARHIDSESAGIRRSALYALHAVDPASADLRIALASAHDRDPIVRMHSARLIGMYGGSELTGGSADAILGLLDDENADVRQGTLRGLSGARVTPAVEQRLIAMAADEGRRREAIRYGLSQLAHKSRTVVDTLFDYLQDDDHEVRARAHWGLQRDVAKSEQPYVARRYAEHLPRFMGPKARKEALQVIARHGGPALVPQLERFAESDLVDAESREMARKVASYLSNKRADAR
jgi:hypothetical protein